MVFEMGESSGSGSTRLIFRSLSEILKNTPPILSENSCVFRPQPTNPEELKRFHANKEMEKMKDDKLKYEEKLVQEFMPPRSLNDTETEKRAKASIDVTEKMNNSLNTAHLWSIPIEYDHNYVAPNLEQGSGLFMGGSAGAFVPFKKPQGVEIKDTNEESGNVTRVEQIDYVKEVKRGVATPRPPKRNRRCWTSKLHDLFVNALNRIGGPEVATPKHILEHMQVEGLTADEVKSHLQKFRIHIRKIAAATLGEEKGGEYSQEE